MKRHPVKNDTNTPSGQRIFGRYSEKYIWTTQIYPTLYCRTQSKSSMSPQAWVKRWYNHQCPWVVITIQNQCTLSQFSAIYFRIFTSILLTYKQQWRNHRSIENQCTITASPHFVPNWPRYGFNVSNFTHLRLHPAENMFKSCAKKCFKISSGVRGNIFLANSYLFMRLFVIRGGNWIWNGIYSQPAI